MAHSQLARALGSVLSVTAFNRRIQSMNRWVIDDKSGLFITHQSHRLPDCGLIRITYRLSIDNSVIIYLLLRCVNATHFLPAINERQIAQQSPTRHASYKWLCSFGCFSYKRYFPHQRKRFSFWSRGKNITSQYRKGHLGHPPDPFGKLSVKYDWSELDWTGLDL